jgi:Xaa-Pro aminopeptidase
MENLFPHFSEEEFARRYTAMRTAMADLDTLVVYGTAGAYNEVLYLSDFLVTREAMLVFPVEGEPTLFAQMYNHVPNARRVSRIDDVRWGGPDTALAVVENLRERGLESGCIGLVGGLPYQSYEKLREALPGARFENFSRQFQQLRLVKSMEEIEFLRKGAELSDRAIEALERETRPGMNEHELVAIVEAAYLGLGGRTHIHYLATTPMANPAVCVPAQEQSTRVIEKGDVLITEISAHFHGYAGQILRPFTIGSEPTAAYQRMYDVAVEVFQRIAALLRPGATSEEVLDAAEYIHDAGYTICDDLLHGFGGGYLAPILRTRRTSVRLAPLFTFQENMTVVIQPNVITEDGRLGVQVGELVRITANGVESLHQYPMRFVRCG